MVDDFPSRVSYNRFVELQQKAIVPLVLFLQMRCLGECSGISFMDSTLIKACHPKREKKNKVFKDIAQKAKGSMGWFFGFKLHIIINERGEIIDFLITKGNIEELASYFKPPFNEPFASINIFPSPPKII